jgi:hypothetical protein
MSHKKTRFCWYSTHNNLNLTPRSVLLTSFDVISGAVTIIRLKKSLFRAVEV